MTPAWATLAIAWTFLIGCSEARPAAPLYGEPGRDSGAAGSNEDAASAASDSSVPPARLGEGCSLDRDCESPLVCAFEICHAECELDRDCGSEARCVRNDSGDVCQLPEETACTDDTGCLGDQVCGVDGECRDTCSDSDDCTTGQVCAVSQECASTLRDKDQLDNDGNIQADPFEG